MLYVYIYIYNMICGYQSDSIPQNTYNRHTYYNYNTYCTYVLINICIYTYTVIYIWYGLAACRTYRYSKLSVGTEEEILCEEDRDLELQLLNAVKARCRRSAARWDASRSRNGVRNGEFKQRNQRKSIGKNGGFNQQNCDLMGFNRIWHDLALTIKKMRGFFRMKGIS